LSLGGQPNASCRSIEQFYAERKLERGNALGDGRLGCPEFFRCGAQTAQCGSPEKGLNVAEIDHRRS
jgi:hypothetical protein